MVGSRRRLDLSLPDGVPVAELLLDLAEMLGEKADGVPPRWGLVRVGGLALDPERDLSAQGVLEGTMLFLRDQTSAPPSPTIDDFAERVAVIVDTQPGRWTMDTARTLLAGSALVCLAAAGVLVLLAPDAGDRAAAGIGGAALATLAGADAARRLGRREFGGILIFASLPLWAAGGAGLAGLAGGSGAAMLAASLAAVSVGALVAYMVAEDAFLAPAAGVVTATLLPAVVLAGCALARTGPHSAAALLCPLGLAVPALGSALAVRLAGIAHPDPASLGAGVRRGRQILASLLIGDAVVLMGSSAILVISGGWFACGLVAATALAVAARARQFRFALEVAPLLAAGLVGLLLLEYPLIALLAVGPRGVGGAAGLLIGDGLVLFVVAAASGATATLSQSTRMWRQLGRLEMLATVATVPLALGVLDAYHAAIRFAHGLG